MSCTTCLAKHDILLDFSLGWVERLTSGSALGEAMTSAKGEDGCSTFYSQCPLNSEKLATFAKELARRYMKHLIQLSNKGNKQEL
ncbi:hypothetical protein J6590_059595 [Homalodisca vitripennis]|nr:hypothetical protein J6590_059595 [Homalodisca vitripennis]